MDRYWPLKFLCCRMKQRSACFCLFWRFASQGTVLLVCTPFVTFHASNFQHASYSSQVFAHVQVFHSCGNRRPVYPRSMYGSVVFQTPTVVDGTTQSSSYDCGCHAIMNMRIMASATVLHHGQFEWPHLQMPTGARSSRDAEWHSELAKEVIHSECELWQAE
jgi:hypothetical protein